MEIQKIIYNDFINDTPNDLLQLASIVEIENVEVEENFKETKDNVYSGHGKVCVNFGFDNEDLTEVSFAFSFSIEIQNDKLINKNYSFNLGNYNN